MAGLLFCLYEYDISVDNTQWYLGSYLWCHLVVLGEGGGHDTPDTVSVQLQRPPAVAGFEQSGLGPGLGKNADCIVD